MDTGIPRGSTYSELFSFPFVSLLAVIVKFSVAHESARPLPARVLAYLHLLPSEIYVRKRRSYLH